MNNCCNTKINFPSDKFKDCCEVIFTNCIAYTGPEGCLDFGTYPNLNDVISAILTHICQSSTVISVNAPCLVEKGYAITDVTTFTTAVSDVICQILGCEVPAIGAQAGTITSLCELNTRLNAQNVAACFQPLAQLGAQASLEQLLQAIQSAVCQLLNAAPPTVTDQYVKCSSTDTTSGYLSQKLQSGNTVTLTTVNAGANEYLKPEIKIDPASTIVWSVGPSGLKLTAGAMTDQYVKNSATDTTPGYLSQKLQSGNSIVFNAFNTGNNEYLEPEVKIDPASTIPWSIGANGLKLLCCPTEQDTDAAINCNGIETTGSINSGAAAGNPNITGVSISVPYTCSIAGTYPAIVIPSNETINGSPVAYASIAAGSFVVGGGTLVFNVTGNIQGFSGSSISFNLLVNGSSCLVTLRMTVTTIYTVPCDTSTWSYVGNPLVVGTAVSATVGSPYLSFQINVSTLGTSSLINVGTVTAGGITFTGNSTYVLSTGVNTVNLIMSGTPTTSPITVPITVNGTVYCNFTLNPSQRETPVGSYTLQCAQCEGTATLPSGTDSTAYNANINFCYTSGVNGTVAALSVTGVWSVLGTASGLTLNIPAGVISAATGVLPGTITGTPAGSGTIIFNIPNTKCSLSVTIASKGIIVSTESTALPVVNTTNPSVIATASASLMQTNNTPVTLDAATMANVAANPNYYVAGTHQLGYDSASLSSVQPVSISYTDNQAPNYGGYITGVNVDYLDGNGNVFGTENYTPSDFYNGSNPYTVNGATYYANSMINLNIPANTAKVKMMLQTP